MTNATKTHFKKQLLCTVKNTAFLLNLVFWANSAISCKTLVPRQADFVYVMVYDSKNGAVQGALVNIDGEVQGKTDVYGRFLMQPRNDKRQHSVTIAKNEYETLKIETELYEGTIVYCSLRSANDLLEEAERLIDSKDFSAAVNTADRALGISQKDELLFIKAIALKKGGKAEKAKEILEKLSKNKNYSEYTAFF